NICSRQMSRPVAIVLSCSILLGPMLCACARPAAKASVAQKHGCCSAQKPPAPERSKCPHCGQAKQILAFELIRVSLTTPAELSASSHLIALKIFTPQV